MKSRYYFLLPNVQSARELADDLLLARVEDRWMHFLAKRGTALGPLHEASVLQKTDLVRGAVIGVVCGALLFGALGGLFYLYGEGITSSFIPLLMLLGALLGGWASSLIAISTPSSQLKSFDKHLEQGGVLLMLDVPQERTEEVRDLIHAKHPEAVDGGIAPMTPVFP